MNANSLFFLFCDYNSCYLTSFNLTSRPSVQSWHDVVVWWCVCVRMDTVLTMCVAKCVCLHVNA